MKHYVMAKVMGIVLPRHDFWDSIKKALEGIIEKLQELAPFGIALAVIGIGAMFIYSNKSRESAKSSLPFIIFGALLIFGGMAFATWVSGVAKF